MKYNKGIITHKSESNQTNNSNANEVMMTLAQRKTTFWKEYPKGALRERREILDLVIEASKEKKAIRLYTVNQSGHFGTFYITSKSRFMKPDPTSRLCSGPRFWKLTGYCDYKCLGHGYETTNHRWRQDHLLMGSYDIGAECTTEHRAFTNKRLAMEYSNMLKSSKAYIAEVREHHAACDRLFGRFS